MLIHALIYSKEKDPRTLDEIGLFCYSSHELYRIHQNRLKSLFKRLSGKWEKRKHLPLVKSLDSFCPVMEGKDYLPFFCHLLGLPEPIQLAAQHVCEKAIEMNLFKHKDGKQLIENAAAAVFLVCKLSEKKWRQKMSTISKCRSLKQEKINDLFSKIEYHHIELLPQEFVYANILACDKHEKTAFGKIAFVAKKLSLSSTVRFQAKSLFRKIRKAKEWNEKFSPGEISVFCLQVCSEEAKDPRDIKEICREWFQDKKLDESNFAKLRAVIVEGLEAEDKSELGNFFRSLELSFPSLHARDYVSYFCILLDLPQSIKTAARTVCENADELNVFKGDSSSLTFLAAAAVHLVCQVSGEKKSIQMIASSRFLDDAVVIQFYGQLIQRLKKVLPSNLSTLMINISSGEEDQEE